LLSLSNSSASRKPENPERLGNLLQQLVVKRPAAARVFANIVAEMLEQLERNPGARAFIYCVCSVTLGQL